MSIMEALNRAYERLSNEVDEHGKSKIAPFGFSQEKISFCLPLNLDGTLAGPPIDLRIMEGKKLVPRIMEVPNSYKRPGVTPRPFFLWDNSAYCLGVTADENKDAISRLSVFKACHKQYLIGDDCSHIAAFLKFIEWWSPEKFRELSFTQDILDKNIIFSIGNDFIHESLGAKQAWQEISGNWGNVEGKSDGDGVCLISGQSSKIARTHPSIRGVRPSSAGAKEPDSIVSFNAKSFNSYGHEQGANAPVSEAAAFAYTTVLNKFLAKGSKNRIQVGDASTVFWADCDDELLAKAAEEAFSFFLDDEAIDLEKEVDIEIRPILEKIRKGEKVSNFAPELSEGVKFYALGLSPNAARISIRFWYDGTFGKLADNYQKFQQEMAIEPKERGSFALWKYLCETAVLNKRDNIAPNLAGNWMQSILLGTRYPQTLFTSILTRIRADHDINARRVAILKSLLIRNYNSKEATVAFDPENRNKGYLLGRLFAIYERIQESAIKNANATIRDKFYGSASAQPRKIFGMLSSNSMNHLSKIRKENKWREIYFNNLVAEVMNIMSPNNEPFPISFAPEEQALFTLGYYHQRNEFFKSKPTETQDTHEEA